MTDHIHIPREFSRPREHRQPLEVVVIVYDLQKDEEIRRHEFNFHNPNRRAWLQKLLVWAWTNGHSVEMYNKSDRDIAEG